MARYRSQMERLIDELATYKSAAAGLMELHEQFQELYNEMWDAYDELTNEAEEAIEKSNDLDAIAGVCGDVYDAGIESFNGGRHYAFPDLQLDAEQMRQVTKLAKS